LKPQDIQDLLRDLAGGKLSADEAALLREHLADDPDLARFSDFVEWLEPRLQQLAASDQDTHPSGHDLVAAALGPLAELPANDSATVTVHLAQCPECQKLVAAVKAADDADAAHNATPKPRRDWQKMAMAATLSLAIIGAGSFLVQRAQAPLPDPIQLAAITRSAPTETTVTALTNHSIPPLLLAVDPWIGRQNADDYTLQVRLVLLDDPGRTIAPQPMAARDWQANPGGFVVVWPERDLPPGHYGIEVRDDGDRVIYESLFQLIPPAD